MGILYFYILAFVLFCRAGGLFGGNDNDVKAIEGPHAPGSMEGLEDDIPQDSELQDDNKKPDNGEEVPENCTMRGSAKTTYRCAVNFFNNVFGRKKACSESDLPNDNKENESDSAPDTTDSASEGNPAINKEKTGLHRQRSSTYPEAELGSKKKKAQAQMNFLVVCFFD